MAARAPALTRSAQRRWALGTGALIGLLGGLLGLGGAEFRLPVLVGLLGYPLRQAIPLNLAVSLVTLGAALPVRWPTLAPGPGPQAVLLLGPFIAGALGGAWLGPALVHRLTGRTLTRVVRVGLLGLGTLLIAEGLAPPRSLGLLPPVPALQIPAALLSGLGIGLVSSLLGVAGGELLIPTLLFLFGLEIRAAGTASLIIALPTVGLGLVRYARQGAFADRRPLTATVLPMSLGSVAGAATGGLLAGLAPAAALKIALGLILLLSAWRLGHHSRSGGVR